MEALISRLFPKFFPPPTRIIQGSLKPWENQKADCNYIHTLSFLRSHRELIGGKKTKKTTSRSYSTPPYYGCGLTPPGCNAHFRKQNNYYCKEKQRKTNENEKKSRPTHATTLYSTTCLQHYYEMLANFFRQFLAISFLPVDINDLDFFPKPQDFWVLLYLEPSYKMPSCNVWKTITWTKFGNLFELFFYLIKFAWILAMIFKVLCHIQFYGINFPLFI